MKMKEELVSPLQGESLVIIGRTQSEQGRKNLSLRALFAKQKGRGNLTVGDSIRNNTTRLLRGVYPEHSVGARNDKCLSLATSNFRFASNNRFFLAFLMFFLVSLTSCSAGGRSLSELEDTKGVARYLIASGDTLKVEVWKEANLSGEVFVREDGSFTMSLIDDVKAEGLTPKQLSESITNRLKKFIPAAAVTVSLVQAAPIRYYLSGQFNKPGEYRSDKKINLLQALATGGGFAPFADETEITLIRKGPSGEESRYILNYNKITELRQPNPLLKTGDFISVK